MAQNAKAFNYPFPYLYDESQDAAHAFGAVCTPELFLFKKDGRRPFELVYHGQFDDSRQRNNVPVTGRDLSVAIDCVLKFPTGCISPKAKSWMQHKVAPVDETVSRLAAKRCLF